MVTISEKFNGNFGWAATIFGMAAVNQTAVHWLACRYLNAPAAWTGAGLKLALFGIVYGVHPALLARKAKHLQGATGEQTRWVIKGGEGRLTVANAYERLAFWSQPSCSAMWTIQKTAKKNLRGVLVYQVRSNILSGLVLGIGIWVGKGFISDACGLLLGSATPVLVPVLFALAAQVDGPIDTNRFNITLRERVFGLYEGAEPPSK